MNETKQDQLEAVDIMRILELLPHRYPFLLVDRIIDIRGDESCIGIKNVTVNEPHFQGHFPNRPIMPGVLIIEGMAQTAGAMCVIHLGSRAAAKLVYFMSIDKTHFRKPVHPGDRLEYHVRKLRNRGTVWKFECHALVDNERVAEAELTAMIADA
ncbi:MAG: 3-hydroxyacyl-ACP dehydratase FabZ [Hyphomicrobiales bacterium]|nr:3-hydroxyacyl-ACP dehydratase FabZ [Hyphomicrobiales bacterium]